MSKKKLLLIHPKTRSSASGFAQADAWHMPPLALAYIAALTPDHWDVSIVDEYMEPIDPDAKADLIGITAYSANVTRAYELSSAYRQRGIPVVLGGIHASMCPEEAGRYADCVVVGEAESIWAQLLDDHACGNLRQVYKGDRLSLESLPLPRRDLLADGYAMDVIQTTRGCPFGCEFCSVTAFNGNTYRARPIPDVLGELQQIENDLVYFIDDNIFGSSKASRDRTVMLCKSIVERGIKKVWASQASINIAADDEALSWAAKSGCRALYVGIESINERNLRGVGKSVNLKTLSGDYKECISRIHRRGIAVVGSFIVAMDQDTLETAKKTAELIRDIDLDVFDLSYLTPYPGTKMFDRIVSEGRLICGNFPDDWDYCDGANLMLRPKSMGIRQAVHGFDYIVESNLDRWARRSRFWKTLASTKRLAAGLLAHNLNKDQWSALRPDQEALSAM